MNKSPLVTVLMPVYNGEKYLAEAIDSVLAQTFNDFELLIINDGSTDGTQPILDSYSDARLKCYKNENQGVAKSLNFGIKLASGNYIWRHDADDICLPEQLQRQIEFLEAHPNFALVSTQIAFMTDNGKIANDYRQPKDAYFQKQPFKTVKREHFNPYSPITHATVLIKKEVFDNIGDYRSEFKTSEDTDLWLRLIEKYNAAVLNYCSYFVRLNSTSATQIFKKSTSFYRDLAYQFADERAEFGSDILQQGKPMPRPKEDEKILVETKLNGRNFRSDLLNYEYLVMLNAKDTKNILKIISVSIQSGWKLSHTWKAIFFPLLGKRIVAKGVSMKKLLK